MILELEVSGDWDGLEEGMKGREKGRKENGQVWSAKQQPQCICVTNAEFEQV